MHRRFALALALLAGPGAARDAGSDQDEARVAVSRGLARFAAGEFVAALADLDRYARLRPDDEPQLWQRGICHYYAGRFEDGRRQFVSHRVVNGDDVENSVWHFLCNARGYGLERARREWLVIPLRGGRFPDPRVPMRQVYELFAGDGAPESVLAAAEAAPEGAGRRNAMHYAHLYLALWHEVHGRPFASLRHIVTAGDTYAMDHAMGRVTRAHRRLRDPRAN